MTQKQYNCELSNYKDEQEAKRFLLKNIVKELVIEEVVTQTDDFLYKSSYKFEEGKDICFFCKRQ